MNQQVISFHYTLTDPAGKKLDSSEGREPLSFVEGAGNIIPGLETHLSAMAVGEKKRVTVPAKQAYGERDAARMVEVPREKFPEKEVQVGDQFRLGGGGQAMVVTVMKTSPSHITLDANHPLAGVDLTFDVELVAKRDATAKDMECCSGAHHHEHGGGCCEGEHHDEHGGGCCGGH
jgi:FKBP-type peptidyl-prolyl cis-trans isomerase SlyD